MEKNNASPSHLKDQFIAAVADVEESQNFDAIRNELSGGLDSLYTFAYHFYDHGKYQKAVDFFYVLTRLNSHNPTYWLGLAAAQQMLKQYEKALDSYSVAALLAPESPTAHFYAAGCFFSQGQVEKGLQALDAAELVAQGQNKHKMLISQLALIRQAWSNRD